MPISRQIRQRRFWDEVGWNGECSNQLQRRKPEETEFGCEYRHQSDDSKAREVSKNPWNVWKLIAAQAETPSKCAWLVDFYGSVAATSDLLSLVLCDKWLLDSLRGFLVIPFRKNWDLYRFIRLLGKVLCKGWQSQELWHFSEPGEMSKPSGQYQYLV